MSFILRGTLYDEAQRRPVVVYFAGLLGRNWPNLTTVLSETTMFLDRHQARQYLKALQRNCPWMGRFTVAKAIDIENGTAKR